MTRKHTDPLTPAEWKVMKIAWQLRSCAAREIYLHAGRIHGMSSSTVKSYLRRLVDKGFLNTQAVGNCFLYRPSRPALVSLCRAADWLLENSLDETTGPLLAYMVERSNLSRDDVAQLRNLLDTLAPEEED